MKAKTDRKKATSSDATRGSAKAVKVNRLHLRRFSEGFPAKIGAWSGDRSKRENAIQPRRYDADAIADLLDWLNQNEQTRSGERVIALIGAVQQYEQEIDRWEKACERLKSRPEPKNADPLQKDIRSALEAAQLAHGEAGRLLRRYAMYPRLTAVLSRREGWLMDFYMAYLPDEAPSLARDDVQKIGNVHPDSTLPRAVSEGDVVLILCGVTSRGDIQRVRRCEVEACKKFFYARPSHKRRCSRKCTEWKEDHDPQFKKSRKEYMRSYRRRKRTVAATQ